MIEESNVLFLYASALLHATMFSLIFAWICFFFHVRFGVCVCACLRWYCCCCGHYCLCFCHRSLFLPFFPSPVIGYWYGCAVCCYDIRIFCHSFSLIFITIIILCLSLRMVSHLSLWIFVQYSKWCLMPYRVFHSIVCTLYRANFGTCSKYQFVLFAYSHTQRPKIAAYR